jgi:hypothetical protein
MCGAALSDDKNFYIWNPSTGDHRILRDLRISPLASKYGYGFGYNSSTNDCNLLVAASFIPGFNHENENFSLKTNSWKRIQHSGYVLD